MIDLFVGQFVSNRDSIMDDRVSQAGNNFQIKLVELLNPRNIISLMPIFFKKRSSFKEFSRDVFVVSTNSGLPTKLNYIYRFIFDSIIVIKLIFQYCERNVLFYNLDKQNFAIIVFAKYLLRKKVFIVVADYSSYRNRSFFDKVSNFMLRKVSGVIVLNSKIQVNSNQKILSGLIQEKEIEYCNNSKLNNNVILSGSLGKTTGFEVALKSFACNPNYNLFITGRPYDYDKYEFKKLLDKFTKYSNIKYIGLVDYVKYKEILSKCDIALSLRNPNDIEHQYNFPSKILEYLSKSKIVISTIEYIDLPSEFLFYSNFDPVSLRNQLNYITNMDYNQISELRTAVFNYLRVNFTKNALLSITNELVSNG